jgi:ADP-ribose pyrophosphatase YjhB (NUDIX family)
MVCVDAIVFDPAKGVLLGKRSEPPVQGVDWFIGGRIFYGENPDEAIKRKVLDETGLHIRLPEGGGIIGVGSTTFTQGEPRHTINLTYLTEVRGGKLRETGEFSKYTWIKEIGDNLHPYVAGLLRKSGVFGDTPNVGVGQVTYTEEDPNGKLVASTSNLLRTGRKGE